MKLSRAVVNKFILFFFFASVGKSTHLATPNDSTVQFLNHTSCIIRKRVLSLLIDVSFALLVLFPSSRSHPLDFPRDSPRPGTSLASCLVLSDRDQLLAACKSSDKTSRRRRSLQNEASRHLSSLRARLHASTSVYC